MTATRVNGFSRYFGFIFRRELISSLIWIASMVIINTAVALYFVPLFEDDAAIQQMVGTLSSPAMQAMVGPIYGPDPMTVDYIIVAFAQEMLVFMMIASAVMNVVLINRTTRHDEELGRIEMIRSLPSGRLTVAVSALVFAFGLNMIIAVLMALGLIIANVAGTTVIGAFVYSFAVTAIGFLFACITLLTAQLFQSARSTSTWAFAALGVFYGVRAYADMSQNMTLNYISPMGLGLQVYSFWDNRLCPLLIIFAECVIIAVTALVICEKRDLGEGVIPAGKGRTNASVFLRSPLGLAWRLTRSGIIIWFAAMFAIGATYGAILGDIGGFVETNEMFSQILKVDANMAEQAIVNNFISLMFLIMALLATVPVAIISGKIRYEEKRGRFEGIFARSVSRLSMSGSYILIAGLSSAAFMISSALGIYAAASSNTELGDLIKAGFAYVPSLLVMIGISVLLIGFLPKLSGLVWAVFAYSFLSVYFGSLLNLPDWFIKITPYGSVPQYIDILSKNFDAVPIIILSAVSAALIAAGMLMFRRRDIG